MALFCKALTLTLVKWPFEARQARLLPLSSVEALLNLSVSCWCLPCQSSPGVLSMSGAGQGCGCALCTLASRASNCRLRFKKGLPLLGARRRLTNAGASSSSLVDCEAALVSMRAVWRRLQPDAFCLPKKSIAKVARRLLAKDCRPLPLG